MKQCHYATQLQTHWVCRAILAPAGTNLKIKNYGI